MGKGTHNSLFSEDSPDNQMEVHGSKGHYEGQKIEWLWDYPYTSADR